MKITWCVWEGNQKIENWLWQKPIVEVVTSSFWYLFKPVNFVPERLVCRLGQEGVAWGGNVWNTLIRDGTEKTGGETKTFKRSDKLGQEVGSLKRGVGTPLETMAP